MLESGRIEESVLWLPAASCAEEYSPALAACPAALAACSCTSSCACLFEALAALPCAKEYSPALAACPKALVACPCAKEIRMLPLGIGCLPLCQGDTDDGIRDFSPTTIHHVGLRTPCNA